MARPIIHLVLHFLVPGITALTVWKDRRWKSWFIMVSTMIVDLDHLLADPVYDPARCSIGFHPLHSHISICAYIIMAAIPELRILGVGLLIHMGLDYLDCVWM
ncbi:MAG: hypothetical protein GY749_36360 [Desulfobacteraceae bacterium]|nr:hypothetical protein [Desulfobacteraceae bacterium]